MKYLNCVYEDELTSSVIKRLINEFSSQISIAQEINAHGFGKIKRDILKYNNAAKQTPFFVITDLDKKECAVTLIRDWFGNNQKETNLIFRVAVREIDAWILADKKGIAKALHISPDIILSDPEKIEDPKGFLMQISKKSKNREIREEFPPKDSYAHQGPLYNTILTEFVNSEWNLKDAMQHSKSLEKAYNALKTFAEK